MLRSSTVSKMQEDGCRTTAHQQGAGAQLSLWHSPRHGTACPPTPNTTSSTLLTQLLVPSPEGTLQDYEALCYRRAAPSCTGDRRVREAGITCSESERAMWGFEKPDLGEDRATELTCPALILPDVRLSSGPSMAPLRVSLCPPILQCISQCNSQVRLSFNTPDALQGEILLNPRATGITSRLLLSSKTLTCPIPPLREETSSHAHQHTAEELICSMPGRSLGLTHALFSSGILIFCLGLGASFSGWAKFPEGSFTASSLQCFSAPSCWLCSQDTAVCRREGHTREKRQTSGAQEPRALLLYWPLACTKSEQVTRTHLPQFLHLLK